MKKILIIEDEEAIAMIEQDYLELSNFETEVVGDGTSALQKLSDNSYDLILLDLMLPGGMSGYDVCKKIRGQVDIPIIMVTAKTESLDKVLGLELGADDYLTKPFDPAELVARVKANLNQYERLKGQTAQAEEKLAIGNGIVM